MISYLGPSGTYSHKAALSYQSYLGTNNSLLPQENLSLVLDSVFVSDSSNRIDIVALAPFENRIIGPIEPIINRVITENSCNIIADIKIDINHCLLGYRKGNRSIIYSHSEAIKQCTEYIRDSGAKSISVDSTAKAAELAVTNKCSVICSKDLLEQYSDLELIQEGVQNSNYNDNWTRFVVLKKGSQDICFKTCTIDSSYKLALTVNVEKLEECLKILKDSGFKPLLTYYHETSVYLESNLENDKECYFDELNCKFAGVSKPIRIIGLFKSVY